MPPRAEVFQQTLIGPETTAGTPVSTTKRLLSTSVILNPQEPVPATRAIGGKAPTGASKQKGMSVGSYQGAANYNDLAYILSSLLEVATGTWAFKPDTFAADTIKTFSILGGGADGAEKIAYGIFNSLRLRMTRTEVSVNGDIFGRILDEAPAVPAVTDIPEMVINPSDIDIALGDDTGSLVVLGSCLEAEFSLGPRYGQKFALKRSTPSFESKVELAVPAGLSITVEHDSESKTLMTELRALEKRFFQIKAVGPVIGAGPGTYEMLITCPFRFDDPRDAGEVQGLHARSYMLVPCYDSTFAGWIEVNLVNEVASL